MSNALPNIKNTLRHFSHIQGGIMLIKRPLYQTLVYQFSMPMLYQNISRKIYAKKKNRFV